MCKEEKLGIEVQGGIKDELANLLAGTDRRPFTSYLANGIGAEEPVGRVFHGKVL